MDVVHVKVREGSAGKVVIPNRPLTVPEVARLAGIAVRTVWREISRGALHVYHVARRCTRLCPNEVARWLKTCDSKLDVEVACHQS